MIEGGRVLCAEPLTQAPSDEPRDDVSIAESAVVPPLSVCKTVSRSFSRSHPDDLSLHQKTVTEMPLWRASNLSSGINGLSHSTAATPCNMWPDQSCLDRETFGKLEAYPSINNGGKSHDFLRETPEFIGRASKDRRSSVSRWSLIPSDIIYPTNLPGTLGPAFQPRVERMLRLNKPIPPAPVAVPFPLTPNADFAFKAPFTPSTIYSMGGQEQRIVPEISRDVQNGRIAWLHALTAMLVVFNCWGMANAFGLFQAYYETYYLTGASASSISWIGSTQLAMVFGLGVPVGRLVDQGMFSMNFRFLRCPKLDHKFLTASQAISKQCSMEAALSWYLASFVRRGVVQCGAYGSYKVWLLASGWVRDCRCCSFGSMLKFHSIGMVFCSGIICLMTWFDEKKIGRAMGLGAAGSCVGGIVYVLVARHLLPSNGFPATMRVLGGICAGTMIPPNLVFRIRSQRHHQRRYNLPPGWRTIFSRSYTLAAGGLFFAFLGLYFGFFFMVSFGATMLKLSNNSSTDLLIVMLAANLPGRFVPALISDRCIGPLNTILPAIFLSAACIVLWIVGGQQNQGVLFVIASFYGFVSAGIQVLYAPTIYAFCLGTVDDRGLPTSRDTSQLAMDRIGVKSGVMQSCIGLACLIGTPIGGALIDYRIERGMPYPYIGAQLFAACSLVTGFVLLLGSRVSKIGWQAKRA